VCHGFFKFGFSEKSTLCTGARLSDARRHNKAYLYWAVWMDHFISTEFS